MKISYKRLTRLEDIIGPLNATQGKDLFEERVLSLKLWNKLLRSCGGTPHSPIRAVIYRFYLEDIPTFVATHLIRHHVGVQPYVQSQREDNTNIPRNFRTQVDPVNMILDINVNGLIDMAKARLCGKASKETREVLEEIKSTLQNSEDDYDISLSKYLKAPCQWYGICFEPQGCKKT